MGITCFLKPLIVANNNSNGKSAQEGQNATFELKCGGSAGHQKQLGLVKVKHFDIQKELRDLNTGRHQAERL